MKQSLLLICLILLFACKNNSIPPDILPEEKMIPILLDVHLAEMLVQKQKIKQDSATKLYNKYYYEIFDKHNISQEQFLNSFDYYLHHPDLMEAIYTELLLDMNRKDTLLYK